MKHIFAYYLLLLYGFSVVKPLLPVVSNWWSHEFYEAAHLSKVHAIYGSHHVDKEIETKRKEGDQQQNNAPKNESQVSVHLVPTPQNEGENHFSAILIFPDFLMADLSSARQSPVGPPPKK